MALIEADERSLSSGPWAPERMQGNMGSIYYFAWLFIFSEILWLNFCETRGLTSFLMRLFLSPHYMNGHRYSIGINSPNFHGPRAYTGDSTSSEGLAVWV